MTPTYASINNVSCGIIPVNFKAIDQCGIELSIDAEIRITDTTAPVISCPTAATGTADTNECFSTTVDLGTATATDNCGNVTISNNLLTLFPTGKIPVGAHTITWTATDDCTNSSTCTQTVTVTDNNEPPYFTLCPSGTIEDLITGNGCSKVPATIPKPEFDDNCSVVSLTYITTGATILTGNTDPSGFNYVNDATLNVGITTVTYTVYDQSGHPATCTFDVWIKNIDQPRFNVTCPAGSFKDIVVPAEIAVCDALVNIPAPAIDNFCVEVFSATITIDGVASVVSVPLQPLSQRFDVGAHTITWTITDASGNVYPCEQSVIVTDANSVLVCPVNIEWPVNPGEDFATLIPTGNPTVTGNCEDPLLIWNLVPPAAFATNPKYDDPTELSGTGIYPTNGTFFRGITTITYSLTDAVGNVIIGGDDKPIVCSFTVTITDEPIIECPDSETFIANVNCEYLFNPKVPTLTQGSQPLDWTWTLSWPGNPPSVPAVNISGGSSTTNGPPAVLLPAPIVTDAPHEYAFQLGVTTIVWTATDIAGNTATCTHTITVTDDEDPTYTLPPAISECVESLFEATYNAATTDITPARPDYFIFVNGNTALDLTGLADNCCDAEDLLISWIINFSGGGSLSGTGQPSLHGSDIQLPGDLPPYDNDLVHTITYTVTDCNGNPAALQTQNITIKPRPNVVKVP